MPRFLELDHVVVSITGTGRAWVDEILARLGRQRRVKVRVPSFFAAVEIAARSDLVMTLPSSLARTAADMRRFVVAPPPLDLGSVVMASPGMRAIKIPHDMSGCAERSSRPLPILASIDPAAIAGQRSESLDICYDNVVGLSRQL